MYNRITYQIALSPLTLNESKRFLHKKGIKLNNRQVSNYHSIKRRSKEKGFWLSKQKGQGFESWSGYAYEAICYKHLTHIRKALELPIDSEIGTWHYIPPKGSIDSGAQIDLLFDRPDDAITLCEIKHTKDKFNIDKEYAKKLQQKIDVFTKKIKTQKQIFIAMITSSGLKESMYSEALVHQVVTLDDLFKDR